MCPLTRVIPDKGLLHGHPGVKVGRNAPERSSEADQFGHKRSGAQTSDYFGRNARSMAYKNVISAFRHACFHKSCVSICFVGAIMRRFAVLNIANYNNKRVTYLLSRHCFPFVLLVCYLQIYITRSKQGIDSDLESYSANK